MPRRWQHSLVGRFNACRAAPHAPGGRLALALLLVIAATDALSQAPATDNGGISRFQRTAGFLQDSVAQDRADFAASALTELAAVYMAEADLARSQASAREGNVRAKLLGWSIAVDQYANQLLLVLDDVEQGYPVSLRQDPLGPVGITVADRTVILGHPRADQQAALETRVLGDFCSSHDCEQMTPTAPGPGPGREPVPVSAIRVNPLWTFASSGPVCANEGLEVHFASARDLATLRGLCEELVQEVAALATDLAWQKRHGVDIDWDALAIDTTPGRPEHLVRLNAAGDSVLLTIPLLYATQNLLQDIKPWLRARASGEPPPAIRLDAARYGWLSSAR